MFITSDQPRILIVSLFIGLIIGGFYEIFYFLKLYFKKEFYNHFFNVLYFVLSSFIFVNVSTIYHFSNFRVYMLLAVFIGILIYLLTLHKIIAIFLNKVYNMVNKTIKGLKARYVRSKEKANILGSSCGNNNVNIRTYRSSCVSISRHIGKKKTNRNFRRQNNSTNSRN